MGIWEWDPFFFFALLKFQNLFYLIISNLIYETIIVLGVKSLGGNFLLILEAAKKRSNDGFNGKKG